MLLSCLLQQWLNAALREVERLKSTQSIKGRDAEAEFEKVVFGSKPEKLRARVSGSRCFSTEGQAERKERSYLIAALLAAVPPLARSTKVFQVFREKLTKKEE